MRQVVTLGDAVAFKGWLRQVGQKTAEAASDADGFWRRS
jgi:hypothetical protein